MNASTFRDLWAQVQIENFQNITSDHESPSFHGNFRIALYNLFIAIYALVIDQSETWYSLEYTVRSVIELLT